MGSKIPHYGGQISLTYQYLLEKAETYVEKFGEIDLIERDTIRFNLLSKDNETLNDFPLIYDIEAVNALPQWRLNTRDSDILTYFRVAIKPEYRYKATLNFNNPNIENYLHAISMCDYNINILSSFPSKPCQPIGKKVVDHDAMGTRNFTNFHMQNSYIETELYNRWNHMYTDSSARTTRRNGDPQACYKLQVLPVNKLEADLYNYGEELFETSHFNWEEAINYSYSLNLAGEIQVLVNTSQKMLTEAVGGYNTIRVPIPQTIKFNRMIYCMNRQFMEYADKFITMSMYSELYASDATEAMMNASSIFGVATVATSILSSALGDFDPCSLVEIARAMNLVYTNPNIYQISFVESISKSGFNISTFYGIFTAQALFISTIVALYICTHTSPLIANRFPELSTNVSLLEWFTAEDRVFHIYQHLAAFPNHVQDFVREYLRVAPHVRPGQSPSSIDTPWASGLLEGEFITSNLFDIVRHDGDHNKYDYISPILPYKLSEMRNFSGQHLSRMFTLFTALLSATPTGPFRNPIPEKYMSVLRNKPTVLVSQFNLLYQRLYKVSVMPFADNQIRNADTLTQRITLMVSLRRINTNLLLLEENADDPEIQIPMYNLDYSLQHTLPLINAFYTKFTTLFGPDAPLIKKKSLLKTVISIVSKAVGAKENFTELMMRMIAGNDMMLSFLKVIQQNPLSPFSRRYLNRIDRIYVWLDQTRYKRGYRDHFYIMINPLFLNAEVDVTRNAFITNGVPGDKCIQVIQEFSATKLVQEMSRQIVTQVVRHDMRGHTTNFDDIKSHMKDKRTAFERARNSKFIYKVIKVNHPIIVTHYYTELSNSFKKLVETPFKENDPKLLDCLRNGTPLNVSLDYQVLNGTNSLLKSTDYNKFYDTDRTIISADLLPMDSRFLELNDLFREFNQPVLLRERPREIFSLASETQITSVSVT